MFAQYRFNKILSDGFVDKGSVTTAISLVGKCFIAGAFSNAHIFTTELFPTEIRNGGLGVSSVVNSLGGMLAPYATYLVI